jgi:hypothetical protein
MVGFAGVICALNVVMLQSFPGLLDNPSFDISHLTRVVQGPAGLNINIHMRTEYLDAKPRKWLGEVCISKIDRQLFRRE